MPQPPAMLANVLLTLHASDLCRVTPLVLCEHAVRMLPTTMAQPKANETSNELCICAMPIQIRHRCPHACLAASNVACC